MSGPQVIHQQRGVAVGPHFWGVRGLAQALLQAVWMGNPGWVLWCLSCSLPGAHTHTHTHTYVHAQRQVPHADLDLGGAHPQPLLQELPRGRVLPVRCLMWMVRVQCQVCIAQATDRVPRFLTSFKKKPG